MRLLCNVGVIHELPLHTKVFSTTNVFKKLNCYEPRISQRDRKGFIREIRLTLQ